MSDRARNQPINFNDTTVPEKERTKHNTEVYRNLESNMIMAWAYQDSPLVSEKPTDRSYHNTFENVLPDKRNLKQFIETELAPQAGQAIGLDVGGLGSRVFGTFTKGLFNRTAGISLTDTRYECQDKNQTTIDENRHHSVISGNMLSLLK